MALGAIALADFAGVVGDQYPVNVALHTDHCPPDRVDGFIRPILEESRRRREQGRGPVFQSHMLDASELPMEENLALAKGSSTSVPSSTSSSSWRSASWAAWRTPPTTRTSTAPSCTSPEDMVRVSEVLRTFDKGLYLLAAVFGNVHGVYKPGAVKLDPTILRDGQEAVADRFGDDARHNLVFHGGSGSSIDEIHETLGYGVVKMNIDTDCQYAYTRPIADHMFKNYDGVLKVGAEVGDKKTYDPRSYMKNAEIRNGPPCGRGGRAAPLGGQIDRLMDRRHQTWVTSERFVPQRFVRPFGSLCAQIEAASGIVLLAVTIVALIWANSRWSATYFEIIETRLVIEFGPFHFDETVLHLINDGLMAIFFFVVGLEIKRELVLGDLRDRRKATLPVVAALGGMVLPALLYILITFDPGGEAMRGGGGSPWPRTSLSRVGVVALLGPRLPSGAKLFLLTLAIADDIGAITVIGLLHRRREPHLPRPGSRGPGAGSGRHDSRYPVPGLLCADRGLIWFLTLESGVHATLAEWRSDSSPRPDRCTRRPNSTVGYGQSSTVSPEEPDTSESREHADHEALLLSEVSSEAVSPLSRLEYRLQTWSSFVVIPIFALANAGVDFRGMDIGPRLTSDVALGVAVGLVVGKTLG